VNLLNPQFLPGLDGFQVTHARDEPGPDQTIRDFGRS